MNWPQAPANRQDGREGDGAEARGSRFVNRPMASFSPYPLPLASRVAIATPVGIFMVLPNAHLSPVHRRAPTPASCGRPTCLGNSQHRNTLPPIWLRGTNSARTVEMGRVWMGIVECRRRGSLPDHGSPAPKQGSRTRASGRNPAPARHLARAGDAPRAWHCKGPRGHGQGLSRTLNR